MIIVWLLIIIAWVTIMIIPVIVCHIQDSKKEKKRLENNFLESLKEKKK